jgi:hypothetical protein
MGEDSTHEETVLFGGAVRMHEDDDIVRVWQARPAGTRQDIERFARALERCLRDAGSQAVLFDMRDSESADPKLQAQLWQRFDDSPVINELAVLVRSAIVANFLNTEGIGAGVTTRAFHEEDEALGWLRPR